MYHVLCVQTMCVSLRVLLQQPIGFWPWAQGFAGSRSGALIATAWASMVHLGTEGYLRVTAQIMQAQPSSSPFATCLCDCSVAVSILRTAVHCAGPEMLVKLFSASAGLVGSTIRGGLAHCLAKGSRPICWKWCSPCMLLVQTCVRGQQGLQGVEFASTETAAVIQTAADFAAGVRATPELQLTGEPAMAVVGFMAAAPARGARRLDMYQLNDALGARGWHLNALQRPPALHMCFTAAHASAEPLLQARSPLHQRLRFTQRYAQHNARALRWARAAGASAFCYTRPPALHRCSTACNAAGVLW